MVRTQIQLTEKQAKVVRKRAIREGVSMAEIIRRLVDTSVEQDIDLDARKRAISASGCVRSGLGDLSTRHDDYLAEAYAE